ncbi:hypothetical protein A4D02_08635 [Niastella koreensis]|uniref:DUF748 domain-containing protein n=2 Tax=Niastella koreensis TaxID=354356 RepID=G8TNY6_NIAKG|nr:hypothetical protein [Niastella koreensis]AEW02071.1 hypothetical protein Niako_5840 [Niastella koreensis GR20-10]OQP48759.1 hypothetical protein A4D02_08635 [Niastella koreensis]
MKKLIFLLILVLLAAGGLIYYKKWRSEFVHKKLPELVFLKSDSLYRITYDSVDIDEVEGEIVIRNLQLFPDSTYKKPTDSSLPRNLMRVTVPEVYISGAQTDAAVLNKEVIAAKIKLTHPVVTMFNNQHVEKDKSNDPTPTTFKLYEILLRGLEKIKVDTILITDADYHICKWPNGDTLFSGSKINAQLYHINISDSTSTDTSRVLFAERASLDVDQALIHGKGHPYNYRLKNIQLLSGERSFAIKSMHITPLLGEAAFVHNAKWQTDRLDFDFYNLLFKKVNVQEILNGNLIADELSINKAEFKLFRDKNYPMKKESLVGRYPQQSFLKIPVNVAIKKVIIQQGLIQYREKESLTGNTGLVIFDDIHATLNNVTNSPADLRKNGICTVHFNSKFLHNIPLTATLQLYLNSKNGKFAVNGNMGSLDATVLNSLSKPMALVEVNSGTVTSLDFNLMGNDNRIKGLVRLLYDDLKIRILKKDENGDLKTKKVMSLMANIIVKNANPGKNKPVRIVSVSHPRDIYRSIFNFIWKSIFEGVQKTVGIDGKLG